MATRQRLRHLGNAVLPVLQRLWRSTARPADARPARRSSWGAIESLEARQLLSNIEVFGTDDADSFLVKLAGSTVQVYVNSTLQATASSSDSITLKTRGGSDSITIGETGITSTIPTPVNISAPSGYKSVSVLGNTTATLDTSVQAPVFDVSTSLTLGGSSVITFPQSQTLSSLTLQDSARVNLPRSNVYASSPHKTLVTGSLAMGSSSILDLADNGMIVHNGNRDQLTGLIASGYSGGSWSGYGIISTAVQSDSQGLMMLGILQNGDQSSPYTTFNGLSVTGGDVLIRFSYNGDADLDGTVGTSDYFRIDSGFLAGLWGWFNGDFNYDGVVDINDYFKIDRVTIACPDAKAPLMPTISGSSQISVNSIYTLALAVNSESSNPVAGWTIYWGDGAKSVFSGNPTSYSHQYTQTGTYRIIAAVQGQRIAYYTFQSGVQVTSGSPSVAINGAPQSIGEGNAVHLTSTLVNPTGHDPSYLWTVTKDGQPYSVSNNKTASFTFTPTANGSYQVSLEVKLGTFTATTSTPTIVVAPGAPSNASASATSSTSIALSWTDNSSSETGYRIEGSIDGSTWGEVVTLAANSTSYVFNWALPNLMHYFRLQAIGSSSNSSYTNILSAKTKPAAPSGLTATELSPTSIALDWDPVDGLSGYRIYRSVNGGAWQVLTTVAGTANAYTDNGLTANTDHEYRIVAINSVGDSDPSTAMTTTLPAKPMDLSATVIQQDVSLWWTHAPNVYRYTVEYQMSGGAWHVLTDMPNWGSHFVTGLPQGYTYYFRVKAQGFSGQSEPSNVVSTTIPASTWAIHGDNTTVVGQTITVGPPATPSSNRIWDSTAQPAYVYGASILVEPGDYSALSVTLNLSTHDSYSGSGGYYDVFSISLTDQPYWDMPRTTPLSFDRQWWWGGTSYTDHVLETKSGTQTVPLGVIGAPMYLNVCLETDGIHPSWGTITINTPLSRPIVSIEATTPQAAEGGSPGQFTVYREGNTSGSLTVPYTVWGMATPGSDYTPLSGSVTFAAGEKSKTINVTALNDTASEGTEDVQVWLSQGANYRLLANHDEATVKILDKKKYLVAFYGAGSNGPAPEDWIVGNIWLRNIAEEAGTRYGYQLFIQDHTEDDIAYARLLSAMNADWPDTTISRAEIEAAEIRVVGYSWGAIQAINFTWHLERQGKREGGYKLAAPVKIEKLLTLDPENSWFFLKHTRGDVQDNVKVFANYYQKLGGDSTVDLFQLVNGTKGAPANPRQMTFLDNFLNITGDPIGAEAGVRATAWWIDRDAPNELRGGEFYWSSVPGATHYWGELNGRSINHGTVPWWTYNHALAFLG